MLEKTVVENEFLVRWNPDKSLSGGHIKFLETITDGGVIISQRQTMAQPVAMAGQLGFPLDTVLAAIHSGAIAAFDAEVTAHATTKAEKASEELGKLKAQTECAALQQKLDAAVAAHVATLNRLKLAELQLAAVV